MLDLLKTLWDRGLTAAIVLAVIGLPLLVWFALSGGPSRWAPDDDSREAYAGVYVDRAGPSTLTLDAEGGFTLTGRDTAPSGTWKLDPSGKLIEVPSGRGEARRYRITADGNLLLQDAPEGTPGARYERLP